MSAFLALLSPRLPPSRELLARLASPLLDAVPDRMAGAIDGPLALAQGFLSTREGAVPGPHRLGVLQLCGDIRLDDRPALAARLRDAGAPAVALDDDDGLVLAAYAAWGAGAWARLRGEFSFALWDGGRQQLHLVRDGLGVRPLFYAQCDGGLICSNHVDAVRAHPAVPATLNDAALVSFLRWGWNVDVHRGAFTAIRRLEAGHALTVDAAGRVGAEVRHWEFPAPPPLRLRDDREYVEGFRDVLGRAVSDRMRQPTLAIQLSGGLDSPSLAATARRVAPEANIAGFTYAATSLFDDREGEWASLVARHVGITHRVDETPWQPLRHLQDPTFRTPEPIDDTDFGHTRESLARIAAHSRVVFVGEDGDALFAPPGVPLMARAWGWGTTLRRLAAFVAHERRLPVMGLHLRDRLRGRPVERVYDPPAAWIRRDMLARTGPQDFVEPPRHPTRPGTKWLLGAYWQTGQEGDSFAYLRLPLEWRWPLLDTRVIEYVLSVPPIPWCDRKRLLAESMRGALPDATLSRRKTVLPPLQASIAQRWVEAGRPGLELLAGALDRWVDTAALRPILSGSDLDAAGHGWRALQLAKWLRTYESPRPVINFESLFSSWGSSHNA